MGWRWKSFALALLWLVPAGAVMAQSDTTVEREIDRDAEELRSEVDVADRDVVDTVLAFTNTGRRPARVVCVGLNKNGVPVGRIRLHVPPGGLRYALGSDLSDGVDFVGSARCSARGVVASGVLLAPLALTDLDVLQRRGLVIYPLVASY